MIDALAVAGLCGLPVARIVNGDDIERSLYLRVTRRAAELQVQMMKASASHIANQVSLLFKKN